MIDVSALRLSVGPTVEPVTLAEMKAFLRVDSHDDDDLIEDALIPAARRYAEEVLTWRTFINTTWILTLDSFPPVIEVPRPPLSSVTSIAYTDTSGDAQTFAAASYQVDTSSEPGRIQPAYGEVWPSVRSELNAVRVTFVAGYGAAASNVPEGIKMGIRQLVAHWYEAREPVVVGTTVGQIPIHVEAIFAEFSMKGFG